MDKLFYTKKEAAEVLGCCKRTIERYIYAGKLPAAKIGKSWKISHDDIMAMYESFKAASAKTIKENNKGRGRT